MPHDPWQHTAMGKSQTFSESQSLANLTQYGGYYGNKLRTSFVAVAYYLAYRSGRS